MTQTDLAHQADVGRQWLISVEQGKPGAELGLVMRTLTALGLAINLTNAPSGGPVQPDNPVDADIDAVLDEARTDRS